LELADIFSALRRRWRIAVALLLLTGAVLAAFYVTRKEVAPKPRFRSEVNVLVPTRDKDGNFPEDVPESLFFGQAAVAQSTALHDKAISAAGIPADQARGLKFGYAPNEGGDLVTFSVEAGESKTASDVALAWANAYVDQRASSVAKGSTSNQDQQRRAVIVLTNRLNELESQLSAIDPALLALRPGSTTDDTNGTASPSVPTSLPVDTALLIYERAEVERGIESARRSYASAARRTIIPGKYADIVEIPPVSDITPPMTSSGSPTLLIVGIGLLLSLAIPVLIDRMDHTIRDAKAATAAFSAPVLSLIPAVPRSRRDEVAAPGTAREAAFRALAATSVATDRLPRSIVVTSPLGDIQDTVAANFAAALASLGVHVALVGTSPRQAWFSRDGVVTANFGNGHHDMTTFPELLELAYAGRLNGEVPGSLLHTDLENLVILPPGETEIDLSPDGLAPLLQAMANANIDVTVIAAPALLEDPNTTIYAWTTRSVLWAMEAGEITAEDARAGAARLALAGVTPFGVAIIDQEN
jgi:capsular polysaccharide biosynthesis protein